MGICKVTTCMQKLLKPFLGVSNKHNIVSKQEDEGHQQYQVRGVHTVRRGCVCSKEVLNPVEKQTQDIGAGRAAFFHPYIDIKGSRYRHPPKPLIMFSSKRP